MSAALRLRESRSERRELRAAVAGRDGGWRCRFCRCRLIEPPAGRHPTAAEARAVATLDHWIPLSRHGTWQLANLVLACPACNQDKGRLTGAEYVMVLSFRHQYGGRRARRAAPPPLRPLWVERVAALVEASVRRAGMFVSALVAGEVS